MSRYFQLDSLRGLAALIVLITHCFLVCASFTPLISYTPLYFLVSGPEAVIFFFVLSGFVLSLSFTNGGKQSYFSYIIKRVCRIYLPFFAAITLTLLLCNLLFQGGVTEGWASSKWVNRVDISTYLLQINLLGNHDTTAYNPVVWSLIHEMRISIIFPFIVALVNRMNWKASILLAFCCSTIGGLNILFSFEESLGYQSSWFDSIHFTAMFIVGSLLAKYREIIINKYKLLKRHHKISLLIFAFLTYTYSRGATIDSLQVSKIVSDWGITVGVSIMIIFAISNKNFSNLLEWKPISFFGRISYSLYLFHTTVLFTFVTLLDSYLDTWIIVLISLIPIVLISYLSWRWIEVPSIALGRYFAKRKVINKSSLENNLS